MNTNIEKVVNYFEQMTDSYLKYGGNTFGWHFPMKGISVIFEFAVTRFTVVSLDTLISAKLNYRW